jgi:small subunit ribosomal protein S9
MARKDRDNKPEVTVEKKPTRRKAETVTEMADIGAASAEAAGQQPEKKTFMFESKPDAPPPPREKKIDAQGRAYATGRRKTSAARVWIKPGSGKVTVNGRDQVTYFARHTHRLILNQPFLIVNGVGKFDVVCTVKGGGLSGQAGAVRHGISRALQNFDPALRPALKKAGMMTRDDRIVERKKVGMHGARRTKQWAKR